MSSKPVLNQKSESLNERGICGHHSKMRLRDGFLWAGTP